MGSSLPTAQTALKEAYRAYRHDAKPKAQTWREFHLQHLLAALVSHGRPGCRTPKQALAMIKREERARARGAASKRMRKKGMKAAVLSADMRAPDGTLVTLHTQSEMVPAVAASNV